MGSSGGTPAGGEGIGGSTGAADERLLRSDGTEGETVQASLIRVDDAGALFLAHRLYGAGVITVPSATDLSLADGATSGSYFLVTGSTQIETILPNAGGVWTGGSIIVLQFDETVTVNHLGDGNGSVIRLVGSVAMVATSGDLLVLIRDAVNDCFREICRSVLA